MKSIIQSEKKCFFCGQINNIHEHHIFEGRNRKNSEKFGLKVWLCGRHHNLSDDSVHFNPIYMKLLKTIGQLYFEQNYNEDFIKIFRRNYKEE